MDRYKVDLHLHTNYSDGDLTPFQLIVKAKEAGVRIISITDHDNVNALSDAISFGKEMGVTVVPGVEISSDIDGQEIHILGYFIDYKNQLLKDYLSGLRLARVRRVEKMCSKLNELGSHIRANDLIVEDEKKIASLQDRISSPLQDHKPAVSERSIGRPHIAAALNEEGFVRSYHEAFIKYIGDGKPAYIKKPNPGYEDVIELITKLGGLSFIAHPGKIVREEMLFKLINAGLDGIELIHPSHSQEDIQYFSQIASEHFLLTSGGSDFHGGLKNDQRNFGNFYVTDKEILNMRRRLFS